MFFIIYELMFQIPKNSYNSAVLSTEAAMLDYHGVTPTHTKAT